MNKHWKTVALGEVLELDLDKVEVSSEKSYEMVGVYSFGKGLFFKESVQGINTSYKHFFKIKPDHIVMSQLFGWEGALALSSEQYEGRFLSSQFPTFLCNPEKLDRCFLGWLMQRPTFWQDLGTRAKGMGDRRRTLNPDSLLKAKIHLPPLTEQRGIVARIEALATKVDEAKKLRQEIVQDNYRMLLGVYQQLIENADYQTMAKVAPLTRRPVNEIDNEKYYPELGVRSFGNGTFHKAAIKGVEMGTKRIYEFMPNDLIFSNVFAWEGAIAVAKPEDAGRFGSHRFITCVPKENIALSSFLAFHFLTQKGLEQIGDASPGGAGRNRTLGLTKLEALKIPLPSIEKQHWLDSLLQKTAAIKKYQAENQQQLNALMPAILDKAFKGEL